MEPTHPITIQPATSENIGTLVRLMGLFYAESGYTLDGKRTAESFSSFLANPGLGGAWLAMEGNRAIGYVVLSIRYTMEHGGLGGHIDDLFVEPEYRRRGAASGLLDSLFAECQARGCKSIHVEAGESNSPAWQLYTKYGLQKPADERILFSRIFPKPGE